MAGLCLAVSVGACGKKGAPLAPFVRVPTRILDLSARRMGETVYVKFTVPAANQDGTTPADLERVDVFAYTAAQPTDSPTLKNATLIASVPVNEPPPDAPPPDENAPPPPTPAPASIGLNQGAIAVVTEKLGPASLQVVVPEPVKGAVAPIVPLPLVDRPLIAPMGERPPTRFYVAVPVSRKGRKGAASGRIAVPLVSPPPAPGAPALRYDERTVVVAWSVPFDAPQPVQTADEPGEQPSRPRGVTQRAVSFNVYEIKQEPPSEATAAASASQPTPLNDKPLQTVRFDDSRLTFGVERCYAVRLVETLSELSVESEASPPSCVTPVDTFPPPAPASLGTIASEGAIDLIWDPVSSSDLAGYLVLRGRAPGETLQPLTPTPIRETFFRDASVERGVRYVYEVVAVDNAEPPNRSAPSTRREEAAR